MLDSTAAMGVDFLMVDVSDGWHYGCPDHPQLEQGLLLTLDIADARIRSGRPTPHIAIMSPPPGAPGGQLNDNDRIYDEIVYSDGMPRPSYVWINGFPLWGVYTHSPFRTDFRDPRFFIRYICNSANNECNQQQVDTGVVWPWATMGNPNTPGCPGSSNNSNPSHCPLASVQSDEITIQNGYQNTIPCTDIWPPGTCSPPGGYQVGFNASYYEDQWSFATSNGPKTILINTYDGIEGGWIQSRSDFTPATAYEDQTRTRVSAWKGTLAQADIGPPSPPPVPQPPTTCGRFNPGEGLFQNQSLWSCNGRFRLVMQPDGNVVLYEGQRDIWQTRTLGPVGAGGFEIIMQPDGNLVVYTNAGTPIWDTRTFNNPGATFAVQDDGNLVIYQGTTAIWNSGTQQPPPLPPCQELPPGSTLNSGQSIVSCSGGYRLTMQPDGNLVLYDSSGHDLWNAGTLARGHHLTMQPDGNLVVYSIADVAVWDTRTFGNPGAYFWVQPDSNLVVYSAGGRVLWSRY